MLTEETASFQALSLPEQLHSTAVQTPPTLKSPQTCSTEHKAAHSAHDSSQDQYSLDIRRTNATLEKVLVLRKLRSPELTSVQKLHRITREQRSLRVFACNQTSLQLNIFTSSSYLLLQQESREAVTEERAQKPSDCFST